MATNRAEAVPSTAPQFTDITWVPLGWDIDLARHIPSVEEASELILAERNAAVEVVKDLSLRAKIIDACGMTCTFCHNEGTPVAIDNPEGRISVRGVTGRSGRISVFSNTNGVDFLPGRMEPEDPNFANALISMRDELGLRELHLTGGEPTLHPRLVGTISLATSLGYSVAMTSNGEKGAEKIEECANAGLHKINFSIFGTTPEELASVQSAKYQDEHLAAKKIAALEESIGVAADSGIKVAANIVMSNESHTTRVRKLIEEFDPRLDIRILPDLSEAHASAAAIYQFLSSLGALPILTTLEAGSSNARVKYALPNGRPITFKQIRPTRLEDCKDCQFNNPQDCKEGYYGLRLYVDKGGNYQVGVCLQRMDLTSSVEDFVSGPLAAQVLQLREQEYQSLLEGYSRQ